MPVLPLFAHQKRLAGQIEVVNIHLGGYGIGGVHGEEGNPNIYHFHPQLRQVKT